MAGTAVPLISLPSRCRKANGSANGCFTRLPRRRQILITRLREVAIEGTIVTPLEIEQAYRKKNEKIKIEYVKIPNDKYRGEVQPSAEDMQRFYKANSARYVTPETKNLVILIAEHI